MKSYWIQVTNLPADVSRELLKELFHPFGTLAKIYLHPEHTFASVYFQNKESAEDAVSLNKEPPYRLQITLHSGVDKYKKGSDRNSSNSSINNSAMAGIDVDDIYGDSGPDLYNIHGICIPTLMSDDGKLYVEVEEVEKIGFALFEKHDAPNNIDLSQQAKIEFEAYMNMKARKYMSKISIPIPDRFVEDVKNRIHHKYGTNNASPPVKNQNSPPQRSNQSNTVHQQNGNFENKQRHSKSSFRDQNPASNEPNKLRKPNTPNNDHRPTRNVQNDKGNNDSRPQRSKSTNRKSYPQVNEKENVNPKTQGVTIMRDVLLSVNRVDLPLCQPVKVEVSHVISPTKCFAYMDSDKNKLQEILYDTNLEAVKKSGIKPEVGQLCAATYCGSWYRAIVTQVRPAIKVQYLDFGNYNEEPLKDVRELPNSITARPALAVVLNFIKEPTTKLEDSAEINIQVIRKNTDNSYQVEEVVKQQKPPKEMNNPPKELTMEQHNPPKESPIEQQNPPKESPIEQQNPPKESAIEQQNPPKELSQLNVVPAGKIIRSNAQNSSKVKSPIEFKNKTTKQPEEELRSATVTSVGSNKSDKSVEAREKTPVTFKEKLAKMSRTEKIPAKCVNPERKAIVDLLTDGTDGVIQFFEKLDDDKCLCGALSEDCTEVLTILDEITADLSVEFIAKIGDSVVVKKEDGEDCSWVRGTVIAVKNGKYSVAAVDYGIIISTDKVAKLEKRFMDIPEFTTVCTAKPEFIDLMSKTDKDEGVNFVSTGKNMVKIEFNNVFYMVQCNRWNPFEETSKKIEKPNEPVIFTTPPVVKQLNSDERVQPVILNEGKLLVRNRETNTTFNKIVNKISQHNAIPLTRPPVEKQLVLCPHESITSLCRGIIQTVNNHTAEVEYIDYGFIDTVPLKNIKHISESLANEDRTLISIKVKGFENGKYTDEEIEAIGKYCEENKKFSTKKCSDDVFDLIVDDVGTSLVTKLKQETVSRLKYKDMKKRELEIGSITNLVCVNIENVESIAFMQNEEMATIFCNLNEEINNYVKTNDTPYLPVLDELCLATFEDEWYRARVVIENQALEVFQVHYIDYGNGATVTSDKIRKIPKEFTEVPAQGLQCCLTEILHNANGINQDVHDFITDKIAVGSSYDAKILGIVDDVYEIKIQSLSKELLDKLK